MNGGGVARYRLYRTSDGHHIALGTLEDKFWHCVCEMAEHPEWLRKAEAVPQSRLNVDLAAYFATLSLAECTQRFAAPDCCVTTVLSVGETMESPHVRHRGLIRRGPSGDLQALFPAQVDGETPESRPEVREKRGSGSLDLGVWYRCHALELNPSSPKSYAFADYSKSSPRYALFSGT